MEGRKVADLTKDTDVESVNCFQCVHFIVTWEPNFPKSCALFGFKSKTLPSAAVYETTGSVCLGFEKKSAKPGRAPAKR